MQQFMVSARVIGIFSRHREGGRGGGEREKRNNNIAMLLNQWINYQNGL